MIGLKGRTLATARLTCSLLTEADKPALRVILADPAVTEPAGFRPAADDAAFDEFFAALTAQDTAAGIRLGGTLIGYIHVYPERMGDDPETAGKVCVGFGFVIGKPWQGRGYGTEVLIALTEYMLSAHILRPDGTRAPVDYCFADHFEGNEASRRVIGKAGYRYVETYAMFFDGLGREITCLSYARGKETPMLPIFDNHDSRIRYFHLELERGLDALPEYPLPEGYHIETYRDGDRDEWIRIGMSAKEHASFEAGLDAWGRYYAGREAELPGRMLFLANDAGEKAGTATAWFDVKGEPLPGEGWLHWVSIRRESQGRGLSKPLICATLRRLAELGCDRARIPTQTTTWVAVKVYLDLGFRPTAGSAVEARDGWRILRRLTNHPALAAFDPAKDDEVLA